jgi:hypothetical protein
MNQNRPPEKDSPLNNQASKILSARVDGVQLELPFLPDDGMSLDEWIEWMPKDTQYPSRRFLSRKAA